MPPTPLIADEEEKEEGNAGGGGGAGGAAPPMPYEPPSASAPSPSPSVTGLLPSIFQSELLGDMPAVLGVGVGMGAVLSLSCVACVLCLRRRRGGSGPKELAISTIELNITELEPPKPPPRERPPGAPGGRPLDGRPPMMPRRSSSLVRSGLNVLAGIEPRRRSRGRVDPEERVAINTLVE